MFNYPGKGRGLWQITGQPFYKKVPVPSNFAKVKPAGHSLSLLPISFHQRFSHRPGLPESHILMKLTSAAACNASLHNRAKALILHIFSRTVDSRRFPRRLIRGVEMFQSLLHHSTNFQGRALRILGFWAPLPRQMKEFQERMRKSNSRHRAAAQGQEEEEGRKGGGSEGAVDHSHGSSEVSTTGQTLDTLPSVWSQTIPSRAAAEGLPPSLGQLTTAHQCHSNPQQPAPSVLGFSVPPHRVRSAGHCLLLQTHYFSRFHFSFSFLWPQVVNFVMECLNRIVPSSLVGGKPGRRQFRHWVKVLVHSGVRDAFSFHDVCLGPYNSARCSHCLLTTSCSAGNHRSLKVSSGSTFNGCTHQNPARTIRPTVLRKKQRSDSSFVAG